MQSLQLPFTISTTLTRAEAIRGMKAILRTYRRRAWLAYPLVGLAIVFASVNLFRNRFTGQRQYGPIITGVLIGFAYIFWRQRSAYIKAYNNNKRLHGPVRYSFSEAGMEVSGEGFNASYLWESLGRVEVLPDMVLVYQTPNSANIILRRFLTEEQVTWMASKGKALK